MTGQQLRNMRHAARATQPTVAVLSGENLKHVNWIETGAGPVPKRVRDKIIGTVVRLRELQERWGGVLDMRNVEQVRKLLVAMGDGKERPVPQLTSRDDIAAACRTLSILPDELNNVCSLRDNLLVTARFFSRPAQRWILAHVAAVRDVLAETPKFFAAYATRSEAIDALTERVRAKLTKEIGVSQYAEYVLGLKLTGENREAQIEESKTAS